MEIVQELVEECAAVLIDECINPRLLTRQQSEFYGEVTTVRNLGWTGRRDNLLRQDIVGRFDVFVTIDKGFEFQHNVARLPFGIIILTAANNQMVSYERVLQALVRRVRDIRHGTVAHVTDPFLRGCRL